MHYSSDEFTCIFALSVNYRVGGLYKKNFPTAFFPSSGVSNRSSLYALSNDHLVHSHDQYIQNVNYTVT